MHIRVLGPIEVLDAGGTDIRLGGPKQRTTLALFVAEVGKVVSVDALIDGLWGAEATDGASTPQTYVSNLRGRWRLSSASAADTRVDVPTLIDSVQFEQAVASAKVSPRETRRKQPRSWGCPGVVARPSVRRCSWPFRLELEARRWKSFDSSHSRRGSPPSWRWVTTRPGPELDVLCTEFLQRRLPHPAHARSLSIGETRGGACRIPEDLDLPRRGAGLDASAQLTRAPDFNHDASLLLEAAPQVDTLCSHRRRGLHGVGAADGGDARGDERHDRSSAPRRTSGDGSSNAGDGVDSALRRRGSSSSSRGDTAAAGGGGRAGERQSRPDGGRRGRGRRSRRLLCPSSTDGSILAASHGRQILLSGDAHAALAASESGWQAKALGDRFKGMVAQ
jgi:hypothetical protein